MSLHLKTYNRMQDTVDTWIIQKNQKTVSGCQKK